MNNKIMQAGGEVVTALGGPAGVFGLLWKLFWSAALLGLFFVLLIIAAIVAWKVYKAAGSFSLKDLVLSVVSEAKGVIDKTRLDDPPPPEKAVPSQDLLTLDQALALKDSILDAVSPMAAANDPAVKAAKEVTSELEAYKATVKFLAGRNAVSG